MPCSSLRIQMVLYNENLPAIMRTVASIGASAAHWHDEENAPIITLKIGDASPAPVLSPDELAKMKEVAGNRIAVEYVFFNENTGYGKGHNLLSQGSQDDFLLFINPDIVFAPRCIKRLVETALADPSVGLVEARQMPIENAKWFDPASGEAAWACGACLLARREAFEAAEGFDDETFFMYCEDVDISWAVRNAGHRVVYQPAAAAFHPHRLSPRGIWEAGETEQYHDALGKLLLARKWGDANLVRTMLAEFTWDGNPLRKSATLAYKKLEKAGKLPDQIEGGSAAATFRGIDHTAYRSLHHGATGLGTISWGPAPTIDRRIQAGAQPANASAPKQPFLSVVIPAQKTLSDELAEALTCLAAQNSADFEVLIAPVGNGQAHAAEALAREFPESLAGRMRTLPPVGNLRAAIDDACIAACGMYIAIMDEGDLVSDNWVEAFKAGVASHPGSVIRCLAVRQFWKCGEAPIIGGHALFCADAIDPAYCRKDGDETPLRQTAPTASWCFPRFVLGDLGIQPSEYEDPGTFLDRISDVCTFSRVEHATVLQRIWTDDDMQRIGAFETTSSAIRQAVPIEARAALRSLRRKLSGEGRIA